MSQYKTQCPRCQTIYPMPDSKLGDDKARANCGKCQHTFFLNAHLISPSDTGFIPSGQSKDHLDIPKIPTRPKKQIAHKSDDNSFDGLDDFLNEQPNTNTDTSPTSDEAWLDELISDNSHQAINSIPIKKHSDDDLSDLIGTSLDNLIPEATRKQDPELIRQKINERIVQQTPTQEQLETKRSLGSYLAWGVSWLLMIAFLGVQYVFFYGDSIAKTDQAPLVNKLCSDCLSSANAAVLTTAYQVQKGQADFSTNLIGTIHNSSNTDQLYPNLKITVIGHNGLIGDLALAPKDYMDTAPRLIAATSSGRFMLTLDVPVQEIATVKIEPFY